MTAATRANAKAGAEPGSQIPKVVPTNEKVSRVKTKTRKERLVLDRHKRITDAGIAVFQEKGFHGATVRDIGNAAGLTQGTIYNYVESKEDILFLVCSRIVKEFRERIRHAFRKTNDPVEALKLGLRGIIKAMLDHRIEIGVLYREMKHLSEEAQHEIIAIIKPYLAEVESHIKTALPGERSYHVGFAADLITFLPAVFALRDWATPAKLSRKAQVDQAAEFVFAGLGLPKG